MKKIINAGKSSFKDIFNTIYRSVFAGTLFITGGPILILISYIIPPLRFILVKIFCRIFLVLIGIKTKIEGKFPRSGSFIVMCNHSSFIDTFIFPIIMRGKYTGIVAAEMMKYPIFSQLVHRFKGILIERTNRSRAIESIKKAEEIIKKLCYHIAIMPEGTRTLNGKIQEFKKGGFHLALNTNVSILPIGINGAFEFKPKNRRTFRPCKINVKIGNPINQLEYAKLGLEGLMNRVKKEIELLQQK